MRLHQLIAYVEAQDIHLSTDGGMLNYDAPAEALT